MSSHNEPNDPNLHENWDHEHERRDVNAKSINRSMIYLLVVVLGSAFFVVWLFNQYEGMAEKRDVARPPVADSLEMPPFPRLQANPMKNLAEFRSHEDSVLNSYGVADSGIGAVRIPIDRAIEIVASQGKVPAMPMPPPSATAPHDTTVNAQGTTNENGQSATQQAGGA